MDRRPSNDPPCAVRSRAQTSQAVADCCTGKPRRRICSYRALQNRSRGLPQLRRTPRPLARREIGDFYRRVYHSPGKVPGSTPDMSFSLVGSRPPAITASPFRAGTLSHRQHHQHPQSPPPAHRPRFSPSATAPRLIAPGSHRPRPPPGSSPPVPAAFPVGSLSPAWGGARFPEGPAETFLGRGGLQGCHAQRESDAPGRPSLPPHRRQAASFSGAIFVQFPRRFSTVARVA